MRCEMRVDRKALLISLLVLIVIVFGGSSPVSAEIINTQSHYTVRDELFIHYSAADLRDLSRRLHDKMRTLKENAGKKFTNLLPTQGKSRSIVSTAKEQRAKLKDQQAVRNQHQEDRLNDSRRKNQDLAWLRKDLKHKSQLNRR